MLIIGGIENVLVEAVKVLHDKYDIKIVSLYHKPQKEILEKLPSDVTVVERNMPPKNRYIVCRILRDFTLTRFLNLKNLTT